MVDLNRLRDTIKRNQHQSEEFPDDYWNKAFVDPDGKIHLGGDRGGRDHRPKSEIHQGVFAAYDATQIEDDEAIVAEFLPAGTILIEQDGQEGWLYDFTDESEQWYQMFLYHDGSLYQVQVVEPELEHGHYGVHEAHLFSDGRLCLSETGGLDDLQQAYAKSVLWANGFSVFQETGQFPFSINND